MGVRYLQAAHGEYPLEDQLPLRMLSVGESRPKVSDGQPFGRREIIKALQPTTPSVNRQVAVELSSHLL